MIKSWQIDVIKIFWIRGSKCLHTGLKYHPLEIAAVQKACIEELLLASTVAYNSRNIQVLLRALNFYLRSAYLYVCLYICISVCLPVCPLVYLKNHIFNFTKFFVHVAFGRGSVIIWQQCNTLRTSGFVDDVMFSRNEPYWRIALAISKWAPSCST